MSHPSFSDYRAPHFGAQRAGLLGHGHLGQNSVSGSEKVGKHGPGREAAGICALKMN
jgi:hypothetical protein